MKDELRAVLHSLHPSAFRLHPYLPRPLPQAVLTCTWPTLKTNPDARKFPWAALAAFALACLLALAHASVATRVVAGAANVLRDGGAAVARNDDDARAESSATREGRLRIFDEVWEQVRERYFDPSMRGVDWQELRRSLRPRAAEARDESELYAVLTRMLGSLQDPHTRVFAPGESADWRVQRYVSVGVSVREIAGEVVVTDVERDSDAAHAGLRAGDAVAARRAQISSGV